VTILSVVSAKGGVGKSTVVANLCVALSKQGLSVLAVDLDPQNASALHFGLDPAEITGLSRIALRGEPFWKALQETRSGASLLPYGVVNEPDRIAFEAILGADEKWLLNGLPDPSDGGPDIIVIDTPPGPSVYLQQALRCANFSFVLMLADAASYATIPLMAAQIETYCEPREDFLGFAYVLNQVDNSRQLARDVAELVQSRLADRLAATIHRDESVPEALASDSTVVEYDPYCVASADFDGLAAWLIDNVHATEEGTR